MAVNLPCLTDPEILLIIVLMPWTVFCFPLTTSFLIVLACIFKFSHERSMLLKPRALETYSSDSVSGGRLFISMRSWLSFECPDLGLELISMILFSGLMFKSESGFICRALIGFSKDKGELLALERWSSETGKGI